MIRFIISTLARLLSYTETHCLSKMHFAAKSVSAKLTFFFEIPKLKKNNSQYTPYLTVLMPCPFPPTKSYSQKILSLHTTKTEGDYDCNF